MSILLDAAWDQPVETTEAKARRVWNTTTSSGYEDSYRRDARLHRSWHRLPRIFRSVAKRMRPDIQPVLAFSPPARKPKVWVGPEWEQISPANVAFIRKVGDGWWEVSTIAVDVFG